VTQDMYAIVLMVAFLLFAAAATWLAWPRD
jgi:hypothetical protein